MARPLERRMGATALEVREESGGLSLTGYASTFDEPYSMGGYRERVHPAAFKRTLGQHPDVRLLINHDDLPLARTASGTLALDTDSRGLRVSAALDPTDPDVARLAPKLRRGDVSQMSFGFRVMGDDGDDWSADWSERTLLALDLDDGDVSVVTYPANPGTSVGLRSAGGSDLEVMTSILRHAQRRSLSTGDTLAALQRALGYVASVDAIVDGAQADLATVLGVPNPDFDAERKDAPTCGETRAAVSNAPWDGSSSRFTIEQWRHSCLVGPDRESDQKGDYKLPVREPDGTLNRNAVHNAAARVGQLEPPSLRGPAAEKLVALYRGELHEDPPESLTSLAGRASWHVDYELRLRQLALAA